LERLKHIVCTVTNDLTYDQRMHRICTALSGAGYFVTLVGFYRKRSIHLEQQPYRQVRLRLLFTKGKLFYLEYNFRLFWYLVFRKFDIYNGIDLDTLLPVFLAARLKGKPVVHDAHEFFTELPEIVDRPFIRRIWKMLERILLPRVQYNYTVSEAIAETLSSRYNKLYHVIRNVPILSDREPAKQERYILYQGALNKGRGLEALMEAMANVDAELYIAGEGDLSAELRDKAAQLPHKARIRFLGYVRPDALRAYTEKAFIGVNLVEHLGLSYYYSLSNKFFDYIHAGIPQIGMQFPEYIKLNDLYHIALLIPVPDPAEIAKALNTLISDQALYAKLQENTLRARNELNWQMESEKLIAIYRHIGK